ncbi:siroheme synthase CysG [Rhodophyticola porphyridii]|uniref:Uroporphyrinogen-III C-methyltransferase n=1 Tax=Rhodophyticola porphyridii TaxID=1852017 RepID=A0A3L9Y6V2_9RHOB|nr:siroheme synthase CysG [Rhodophyticola porphyridii]RMA42053.1 uroporphyrinogen-III C-methyltransferase [Rhodophyticola porphyridii]
MQHFPIFLAVAGRLIVVSGGGEAALAKLRLLMKTEARLSVFASDPAPEIDAWAAEGRLTVIRRPFGPGDALCAALFYAANDDEVEDARVTALAQADGALTNWVDNLERSQFITPAIVDRDPVTVAIGTEGAAPVLARAIKSDLEARLPVKLGLLARVGKGFRKAAEALPMGRARRDFWAEYYFKSGPEAADKRGEEGALENLETLLSDHLTRKAQPGRVALVGAGPGDPELLTLKARRALDEADVVIYDRLVAPEILELARREAVLINAGKEGFGPSMSQQDICGLIIRHAADGAYVVRLKSGDPTIYGRLDEEIEALEAAGVPWSVVPGITAASAAAAGIGQSLTKRDRNSALRFLTGHDVQGFAEHDWRGLARRGEVAAIYMAKRGARFLQGRLLMHGAAPDTPVSVVENASRIGARVLSTTLARLAADIDTAAMAGPAILLYGLSPRAAEAALPHLQKDHA